MLWLNSASTLYSGIVVYNLSGIEKLTKTECRLCNIWKVVFLKKKFLLFLWKIISISRGLILANSKI